MFLFGTTVAHAGVFTVGAVSVRLCYAADPCGCLVCILRSLKGNWMSLASDQVPLAELYSVVCMSLRSLASGRHRCCSTYTRCMPIISLVIIVYTAMNDAPSSLYTVAMNHSRKIVNSSSSSDEVEENPFSVVGVWIRECRRRDTDKVTASQPASKEGNATYTSAHTHTDTL